MPVTDQPISGLTAVTGATLATGDLIEVIDVSDLTDAVTGSNRKITVGEYGVGLTNLPDFQTAIYAAAQVPFTTQTADFTSDLTMNGRVVLLDKGTAGVVTIPLFANVAHPVGTWLYFLDIGTARWSFAPFAGVTINPQPNVIGNPTTLGVNSFVAFYHRTADTWDYFGSVRVREPKSVPFRITDLTTTLNALTVGDDKERLYLPAPLNGYDLVGVRLFLKTASSANLPTFQIARVRAGAAVDVLSTKLSIDVGSLTSVGAATPVVINGANDDVATDDYYRFDLDITGTGAVGATAILDFA